MKKCLIVLACGVSASLGFSTPTLKDGVLTYDVTGHETESKTFASYGTVSSVVKKGAGTLAITVSNSGYKGTIDITSGIFVMSNGYALGSAPDVYVRDGAQLKGEFASAGQQTKYVTASRIHVIGVGPDGNGSVVMNNDGMGDNIFSGSSFYLDGNTTFGGSGRWGYYLVMNGHTLTDAITSEHMMNGIYTENPGHIIFTGGWRLVVSNSFPGDSSHTLTVNKSGHICFWNNWSKTPWTLVANEDTYISAGAGNGNDHNHWQGPVVVAKDKKVYLTKYNGTTISSAIKGEISGEGSVCCSGGDGYTGWLMHANTYAGATTITSSGRLMAEAAGSIPENSPITISGDKGKLGYTVDEGHWTFPEIAKRMANTTISGSNVRIELWTSAGQTITDDYGFTPPSSSTYMVHNGDGTLITTGKINGGSFGNDAGNWIISAANGSTNSSLWLTGKGTLTLKDGCRWYLAKGSYSRIGSSSTPRLVIDNAVIDGAITTGGSNVGAQLKMSETTGERSILEIKGEKAAFTNDFLMSASETYTKSLSAVYQRNGAVRSSCNSTADGVWGGQGYAYYEADGGTTHIGHCMNIGRYPAGTGFVKVDGGSLVSPSDSDIFVGSSGTGIVEVTSGNISIHSLRLGQREWATATAGGKSVLTIDGDNALAHVNWLTLGQRPFPALAVVNLNAGVLSVSTQIGRMPTRNYTEYFYDEATQPFADFNFNGGTLRVTKNLRLFAPDKLWKPTSVTSFEKGATIDCNGFNVTCDVPIEAPTEFGVVSVELPANCPKNDWLGPQLVNIFGGSGHGATAITDFDSTSGTISKVTVTSAGVGYKEDDTLVATICGTNRESSIVCNVKIGALTSGGLTLTNSSSNAGMLTLKAANTYRGKTIVAGGTLKVGVANAIPAESEIVIVAGKGTLDVTGFGLEGKSIAIDGSALSTQPEEKADRHLTLVTGLTSAPTYTGKLPDGWKVSYDSDKGTFNADFNVGLTILIK